MILAIDQGSSKTQALIGDEQGSILGIGKAEGACHFLVGIQASMKAVRAAADAALRSAGLKQESIHKVSAGMSGANWPDEFQMLREHLDELFAPAVSTVYNDSVPALYAGTRRPDAIILCAGTSFNSAVLKDGKLLWIYNNYIEKKDEGGKGLAELALRSIFRAQTHIGPPTSLTERALAFFQYDDIQPMLLDFDRLKMARPVKDFSVIVDEEAMKGDTVALNVQYEFGVSVSRYAKAALQRFAMLDRPVDIVVSGGVFKSKSPVMIDAIRTEVHRIAPRATIVDAMYEPVVGAYLLGLDSGSVFERRHRVEKTAIEHSMLRLTKEETDHA